MKKVINFIKNPKTKMVCILSILLFIYTSICALSYAKTVSSDISDSVFRLHVIANSDSIEDQNLKYKVRDNLIEYMNTLCANETEKSEVIKIAIEHQDEFKKIAEDTIKENGFDYTVKINIGNFEFPTKTYGDISFPAGYYDALRVEIGKAQGQNWWCVMFPPLCFIDVTSGVVPDESKEDLKENMNTEDYALISENNNNTGISFKFKLLEFFTNAGFITAKNN